MQLLIECARPHRNDAAVRHAAERVEDWSTLLEHAGRHAMTPLVYWVLSRTCPEIVPPPVLAQLRSRYHANALRNLNFGAELIRLISVFEGAAIGVVPFKGPAVAWSLYESPALREMTDLDLLVHPADAARAVDLLMASGYQPTSTADLRFFRIGSELPLSSPATGVAVDLHWALAPTWFCYGLDTERAWTRLAPVQVAGRTVPALANEDLLVFLCVHGAKHGWSSLHWLADLARLIDRSEVDWDALIARARDRRISRMVFAGLLLAVDVLGATIPAATVAHLRAHSAASRLATRIRHCGDSLVGQAVPPVTRPKAGFWLLLSCFVGQAYWPVRPLVGGWSLTRRYQLQLLERAADKLRYCWSQLAPSPADLDSLALPRSFFPVYYAFRPLRLVAKYAAMASRRAWANVSSRRARVIQMATPRDIVTMPGNVTLPDAHD